MGLYAKKADLFSNTGKTLQKNLFWAKTKKDGSPGISVLDHMLNVGCVAQAFLETGFLSFFETPLTMHEVAFLAALHDIGKISPGFQRKCAQWLEQNNLKNTDRFSNWAAEMESSHAKTSQVVLQSHFGKMGIKSNPASLYRENQSWFPT